MEDITIVKSFNASNSFLPTGLDMGSGVSHQPSISVFLVIDGWDYLLFTFYFTLG